jgi:hypothetical protein
MFWSICAVLLHIYLGLCSLHGLGEFQLAGLFLTWLTFPSVHIPGICHLAVTLALLCVMGIGDLDGVRHTSYVEWMAMILTYEALFVDL